MDQNTKDILDSLTFIKEHMLTREEGVTKNDVQAIVREEISALVPGIVSLEVKEIRADLKEIRRDLDDLASKVDSMSGFAKEIDHALSRIGDVEQHLGLDRQLAA